MLHEINSARQSLTHKWLESKGYIISDLATAALVLKHWAINIHSARGLQFWTYFIPKYYIQCKKKLEAVITFLKKTLSCLWVKAEAIMVVDMQQGNTLIPMTNNNDVSQLWIVLIHSVDYRLPLVHNVMIIAECGGINWSPSNEISSMD